MLLQAQQENDLDPEMWLAIPSTQGALLMMAAGGSRRPPSSPMTLARLKQSSQTQVHRVCCSIPHCCRAGPRFGESAPRPLSFVAATYDLPVELVEQAASYEASLRGPVLMTLACSRAWPG